MSISNDYGLRDDAATMVDVADAIDQLSRGYNNSTTVTATGSDAITDAGIISCNNSSDITRTLPDPATAEGLVFCYLKVGNNTNTVTIATPSGSIIGNHNSVLYLRSDAIALKSDGTNWHTIWTSLIPHIAKISRASAQSIGSGSAVKILFDTTVLDQGGMVDIANSQVVIRRAGEYLVFGGGEMPNLDDGEYLIGSIYVNGAETRRDLRFSCAANQNVTTRPISERSLSATNTVTLYYDHSEGGAQNTPTAGSNRPFLYVIENRR